MRALVTDGQSSRWKVAEVPPPDIGPHEALVEVAAAGLNHADLLMRQGRYLPTSADWNVPANRVGFEMAGRVRAVGPHVRGIAPGQFVMAQTGGACAELVAVDHQLLLPVPESVAATDAAGLPSALLTEYDALTVRAGIRPADRVLITGATSGVGLVGVQLARALGAGTVPPRAAPPRPNCCGPWAPTTSSTRVPRGSWRPSAPTRTTSASTMSEARRSPN
ncbi:quinone oxidoreductase family protein [Streptomyces niveus]|uniref:quinone oxidoreductase family protein n=1 Tax=Streptomyces niveus TaxID=193462 RepID=UPI0034309B9B